MSSSQIKALAFDVFGTVVDWRSSISRQAAELGAKHGVDADWDKFADDWRAGYGAGMAKVNSGEDEWKIVDQIHRERLEVILEQYGFPNIDGAELTEFNKAWHRLDGWPDSTAGLTRLKSKYIITSLSNGNIALLTNMAKYANLPWDAVLSAEFAGKYKTHPRAYQRTAELLGLDYDEVMLVAAHTCDLRGAINAGLKATLVTRPDEYGNSKQPDLEPESDFDYFAKDFHELADQLGCD
ncbi:MAG: haloacid dehalogenase type II [Chloroflexi bacterium]|jgi:2-haloacid dehalogenase|nr:haloacid dehalogenase type II [Chloroflexota bacterium]